jgi:hypothetical protein
VARRRLDREAGGFEPADELAHVLSHPFAWRFGVGGMVLGRPPSVEDAVVRRIMRERQRGRSLRAIAESLNEDAVPTGQGGKCWYPATVRAVALRAARTSAN